jgi:hypothetical protein
MFIISRLPPTHIASFIKIFSVLSVLSQNPFLWTDRQTEGLPKRVPNVSIGRGRKRELHFRAKYPQKIPTRAVGRTATLDYS